jgi:NAD(P)-dependent dehydrogenase (short-subunit alcohol dehydrogenase family)
MMYVKEKGLTVSDLDADLVPRYLDLLRLEGRRFLVAGGGRSMGRQVVHALCQAGARVAGLDYHESVIDTMREVDGLALLGDATVREDVAAAIARVQTEWGGLDGVIDVIGQAKFEELCQTSEDTWRWSIDMGVRHAFLLLQIAGPLIERSGGGSFAFVGSISGVTSAPGHGAYGAGKAALLSLVRTAAIELFDRGIRVNAVNPGSVATTRALATHAANGADPDASSYARTYEIAAALLFLSSPMALSITGQSITVDNAMMVRYPMDIWSPSGS